jgi:Flavoprotein
MQQDCRPSAAAAQPAASAWTSARDGGAGRYRKASARVLYVIACAAPPTSDVARLVSLGQQRGWDVCVLTTPSGRRFADIAALAELTGHPVRSEYKNPGEPDVLPPADAIIVAPATVNTINKWAAGICDTLALGILVEAIGRELPVVAVPFSNRAHAAHPAFTENVARLRSWGVTVLSGPGVLPQHDPGSGDSQLRLFPWQQAIDAVAAAGGISASRG